MAAVSTQVTVRSSIGTFLRDLDGAATRTVKRVIEEGADLSRAMAPVGTKDDPRTIPLKDSISTEMLSATQGRWRSDARHSLHQEFGTGPHEIIGSPFFQFFWDAAGRWWVPGLTGEPDVILHPGHGAQPFLKPAYAAVQRRVVPIMQQEYPG